MGCGRGRSRTCEELSRGVSDPGTTAPPRSGSHATRPSASDLPAPPTPGSRETPLLCRCPGTRQPVSGGTWLPPHPRRRAHPPPRGRTTRRIGPRVPPHPLLLVQHEAERPHADEVVGKRAFEEGGVDELLYLPTTVIHFCSPFVG